MYIFWLFLGLAGGSALIFYTNSRHHEKQTQVLSVGLLIVALIYVGFAFLWGDLQWVLIESVGVVIYGAFCYLAVSKSAYWLAVGWAAHSAWDVVLHLFGPGHHVVPEWYAVACISFDFLVAGYVFYFIARRESKVVLTK